ncbi:hypothetical protein CsSME_00003336 [Camellia sinensis var. sinensis]
MQIHKYPSSSLSLSQNPNISLTIPKPKANPLSSLSHSILISTRAPIVCCTLCFLEKRPEVFVEDDDTSETQSFIKKHRIGSLTSTTAATANDRDESGDVKATPAS